MNRISFTGLTVLSLLCVLALAPALAGSDQKVVLQLSDNSIEKQTLVLNVADNLSKEYGDQAQIEVVAFGPGLDLLSAENTNSARISRLAESGVRFSACSITKGKLSTLLGSEMKLHESAVEVHTGAARIVELVHQGYVLIRP